MKKILYSFLVIASLGLNSCADFLNVNTNPNAPTVTIPDFVLAGALVETARIKSSDVNAFSGYWAGYFAASGSYSQSGDVVRNYILNNSSGVCTNSWQDFYGNLANYNYVQGQVRRKAGYDYWVAICKIMMAYDYQNLVDMYNNVPYTKALLGFSALSPSYDDAATIYASLSTQLDSAVTLIKNAPSSAVVPGKTVDVMFGGDMAQWAALANTLRLRLMIHQSQLTSQASYISGEIAKITANGYGYLQSDALIQPGYTVAAGTPGTVQASLQNPFWETNGYSIGLSYAGRDYNRVSNFALKVLSNGTTNYSSWDPRVDMIMRDPGDLPGTNDADRSKYFCIDFGALPTTDISSAYTCGFGPGVMPSATAPVVFISAAQSSFLQAEAAWRGWISGDVQTLYEQGITQSFVGLNTPGGASAAPLYYNSGTANVDWSVATTPSEQLLTLITQKWIALYAMDCMEAWSDVRRLGNLMGVPLSLDPGRVSSVAPIRLLYPQVEYNTNNSNVNKEGTISQFTSKVFWNQ